MRILGKAMAIGLAPAAFGGAATAQTTVRVGSKNFTEQFVVAELYAAAQELNRQVEVDKKEPRQIAAAFLKAKRVTR